MQDLKRLLIYGGGAGLLVLILSLLGTSQTLTGGTMVTVAIVLVVILPIVLGIIMANKEQRKKHS